MAYVQNKAAHFFKRFLSIGKVLSDSGFCCGSHCIDFSVTCWAQAIKPRLILTSLLCLNIGIQLVHQFHQNTQHLMRFWATNEIMNTLYYNIISL